MDFTYLYEPYEDLVKKADEVFAEVKKQYPECVTCQPHCADCCHAVFGLFLIEAVFLRIFFDRLDDTEKEDVLSRAKLAEQQMEQLNKKLNLLKDDDEKMTYLMASEKIRCPLLNDSNECILYAHRPITCRVYGIPVAIQEKAHICPKAQFQKGQDYPFFNLDIVYRELYSLSKELLKQVESRDINDASLLVSVAHVVKTPVDRLINEGFATT
ncbi:MAG: YkgJ family cysteine cluster protein [Deltaproteobacteria bacterium]|nr:YkgJ family cysteine cluster protein [Deltaproteobacteria bacterium]